MGYILTGDRLRPSSRRRLDIACNCDMVVGAGKGDHVKHRYLVKDFVEPLGMTEGGMITMRFMGENDQVGSPLDVVLSRHLAMRLGAALVRAVQDSGD